MTKSLFKMKKLNKLLDNSADEAEALINNPTKQNAETCDKMTELAQQELKRLIKEKNK